MVRYIGPCFRWMLQVRNISLLEPSPVLTKITSTALTLERVTSEYPKSGSLITFSQFFLVSLHGLAKFVTFTRGPLCLPVPRLLPRRIPFIRYLTHVGLFYFLSLFNNLAFGYGIPMPVHIIFRSGGLVVSMLMGWSVSGKS